MCVSPMAPLVHGPAVLPRTNRISIGLLIPRLATWFPYRQAMQGPVLLRCNTLFSRISIRYSSCISIKATLCYRTRNSEPSNAKEGNSVFEPLINQGRCRATPPPLKIKTYLSMHLPIKVPREWRAQLRGPQDICILPGHSVGHTLSPYQLPGST